jgi:hypothetical protein
MLHTHPSSGAGTVGQLVADVQLNSHLDSLKVFDFINSRLQLS